MVFVQKQKYIDYLKNNLYIIELIIAVGLTLPMIIDHFIVLANSATGLSGMDAMGFITPLYAFIASSIVTFGLGRSYFVAAFKQLFLHRRTGMATLVSFACLLAYGWSVYQFFAIGGSHGSNFSSFFEISASIIMFLLVGDLISTRLSRKIEKSIDLLAKLKPINSNIFDEKTKTITVVSTELVKVGDLLVVKKGEKIPVDGHLISQSAIVDESLLTGEVIPISKREKDVVTSGTINLGESFILKSNTNGTETVVNQIVNQINKIKDQDTHIAKVADKISQVFAPSIILLGILTFFITLYFGSDIQLALGIQNFSLIPHFNQNLSVYDLQNVQVAVYFSIAVIAISCPCALGLAAPLATSITISKAAKIGVIYNNLAAFDKFKKIDAIAFDKTGTITLGVLSVTQIYNEDNELKNLAIIKALETHSIHPIAKSVVTHLEKHVEKKSIVELKNVEERHGVGMFANLNTKEYSITSLTYAKKNEFTFSKKASDFLEVHQSNQLELILVFAENKKVKSLIYLKDQIKENAHLAIEQFKKQGIKTVMITGDTEKNAKLVDAQLKLDKIYFEQTPSSKAEIVAELQNGNQRVIYVGDGINDLISLKQADLSISLSLDNESANAIADISIANQNLLSVNNAILMTKWGKKFIWANFAWAFIYNTITIPLALLGLIPAILSAIVMGFSSMTVVLNSLYFYKKKVKLMK